MDQDFAKISADLKGRRRVFLAGLVVWSAALFSSWSVHAFEITPFTTRNQSPIIQIYGLPPAGSAVVASPGRGDFHLLIDHSSSFVEEAVATEQITLDGETTRLTIGGRYGLGRNVEIGIGIPWISHGGGFLDGFLIDYHNLLGLPQGGRDQSPRNRLLYRYRRHGADLLKIDGSGSGLGDIALSAGVQLFIDDGRYPRAAALRAAIKFPTGESASLLGSGSADFSLWLSAGDAFELPLGHGSVFGSAGLMLMADGNILPGQQADHVLFGNIGAGWKPLNWIAFKVQADAHTPFYRDSEFKPLSSNAVQLVMGGTLGLTERTSLDIAVSEDLAVGTSPDVTFHFSVSTRF